MDVRNGMKMRNFLTKNNGMMYVELDTQFLRLHNELFAEYDCSKCRNCCKMYKGSIPEEDIEKDAEYLGVTTEPFTGIYGYGIYLSGCI